MGYKINSISVENFRYLDANHAQATDFEDADIVVLDGPNGYGKSTLFDAIELLITGKIRHFKDDIQNRGSVPKSVLANSDNKDIVFKGSFLGSEGETLNILRKFDHNSSFNNSSIYVIEEEALREITQEDLYRELNINENIFHIAAYISQSDSLNFLQKKYKDRKAMLTGVLDNPIVLEKIEQIKSVRTAFEKIATDKKGLWYSEEQDIQKNIGQLEENLNQLQSIQESLPYRRMFEKDWEFDRETIDITKEFSVMVEPLEQMKDFIINFQAFLDSSFNTTVQSAEKISKDIYRALYYKKEISFLLQNKLEAERLVNLELYRDQLISGSQRINEALFQYINIPEDTINEIKHLEEQHANINKQMDESQITLNTLIDNRKRLLESSAHAEQQGVWPHGKCPLCGFESEELAELFKTTEELLQKNSTYFVKQLQELKQQISNLYQNSVTNAANNLLQAKTNLLTVYKSLNKDLELSTIQLEAFLDQLNIVDFNNASDTVDFNQFEQDYQALQEKLRAMIRPMETVISEQKQVQYGTIWEKYYNNITPEHNVNDFNDKRQYISDQYANIYGKQLIVAKTALQKIQRRHKDQLKKLEKVEQSLKQLVQKYNDAYKEHQSIIANAIKIPLYLYSGRIIQNYPLGLGIIANVEENQIVFKAGDKNHDAFNILSTGQLNGVMLYILLAVRNTFRNQIGLDMLLIDDPLQSIDDISAFSFTDLLSEQFGNLRIIISTHEDDKTNLFRYKFHQCGRTVKTFNMQKRYLEE